MKYKQYQKYKDSGVEWIGEIPEHWEVIRFANLFKRKSVKNNKNERVMGFLEIVLIVAAVAWLSGTGD